MEGKGVGKPWGQEKPVTSNPSTVLPPSYEASADKQGRQVGGKVICPCYFLPTVASCEGGDLPSIFPILFAVGRRGIVKQEMVIIF